MRRPSPHVDSLRNRLWGLVQRRAVLRATDRETSTLDERIDEVMEQLRRHGITPIELRAELAEAEENAAQLRETLYKNTGAPQQTLLEALIELSGLTGLDEIFTPDAVFEGIRIADGCYSFADDLNPGKRLVDDQLYWMAPIFDGISAGTQANYTWFLRRWGHLPWVLIIEADPNCVASALGLSTLGDLVTRARSVRFEADRILLGLSYPMDRADAQQMVKDALASHRAGFDPLDQQTYMAEVEGLLTALWQAEMEDPIEFVGALRDRIAIELGVEATDADAESFIEAALGSLNLRHLYEERWGGSYRIEPDDTYAVLPSPDGLSPEEIDKVLDGIEPFPIAFFAEDADVLQAAMDDPDIRAIYATNVSGNPRKP